MARTVFVSYERASRSYAQRLAAAMEKDGLSAWLDVDIPHGSTWELELRTRIRESSAVVVLMTPAAEESEWCANERHYAREHNKPVYPLLLEGECFLAFSGTQYVDVRNGDLPPQSWFRSLAGARGVEPSRSSRGRRSRSILGLAVLAVLAAIVGVALVVRDGGERDDDAAFQSTADAVEKTSAPEGTLEEPEAIPPPAEAQPPPTETPPPPTEPTTPSPSPPSSLVCCLALQSGLVAQFEYGLSVGRTAYSDREYTYRSLPADLEGAAYLVTRNDDKFVEGNNIGSFEVLVPSVVYVGYDDRYVNRPSWLDDYIDTDQQLVVGNPGFTMRLFARWVDAGSVILGGNFVAGEGNYAMYVVIVQPEQCAWDWCAPS